MSKSEKRQRSEVLLGIRCYPEEKEAILQSAKAAGLSTGEFLRRSALGRKIVARGDSAQVRELMKLGGLQKHLYNEMQAQMTPELSKQFSEVMVALKKAIISIDMGIDGLQAEKTKS
ncbi:mobilization protein [Salmonella enterica]|nr:mobilization protein [Salmonella enterica]EDZ9094025.1 mobilization protein [Salmonella enterica]EKQ5162998.1 mobilization protein [Salmonella enterica]